MSGTAYTAIQGRIQELTGLQYGLPNRLAPEPLRLPDTVRIEYAARYELLREFQRRSLALFFASLDGEANPAIADEFLRDLPPGFRADFHRGLPRDRVQPPAFFRTDEPAPGLIAEVQCPGSGWGEQSLLHEFYGVASAPSGPVASTAAIFNASLRELFCAPPRIQHFVENSSSYLSNALHIAYSRRADSAPQYWGFDADLSAIDCNFIRTHLCVSLLAENFTSVRLDRFRVGELRYDLPPICLFEQKLLLHLPFDPRTAEHYSDRIRALFPFTAAIRPSGLILEDGDSISLEDFASLPKGQRNIFLKYAGIDPSRNWGSRAVYHAGELSRTQLRATLDNIVSDYGEGRGLWIAQAAHSQRAETRFIEVDGGTGSDQGYAKFSGFYGPTGFVSANRMVRSLKKVHGQRDTILSLVVFTGTTEEVR